MNFGDAFSGLIGGAARGVEAVADQNLDLQKKMDMERLMTPILAERAKAIEDMKNTNADARRAKEGTPEFDQAQESKLRIKNEELRHSGLVNAQAESEVRSGRDGKLADGSFVAVGDDGVARRIGADGTPVSGKLAKDGTLAGTSSKTYGMDEKEKLGLDLTRSQIAASGQASRLHDLQYKSAVLTYDRAVEENKIPAAVDRQYKVYAAEYEKNGAAIAKARAEDKFVEGSEGAKRLLADQAAAAEKMSSLIEPYMPKSKLGKDAPSLSSFDKGVTENSAAIEATEANRRTPRPSAKPSASADPISAPAVPEDGPLTGRDKRVAEAEIQSLTKEAADLQRRVSAGSPKGASVAGIGDDGRPVAKTLTQDAKEAKAALDRVNARRDTLRSRIRS